MTHKFSRLALSAVAASLLALPAFAQSSDWKVDSNHSVARIAITAKSPDGAGSGTLGGAAVSGTLRLDNSDPSKSTLQLDLYPAGSGPAAADGVQSILLSFRSEKAALTPDGKLKVTGTLTVTRVVRILDLTANEAYSGPVEVGRQVVKTTREESLILPVPSADPRDPQGNVFLDVSTELKVNREDFPELVDDVLSTNWPAKAQDESCQSSPSAAEDYAGTLCTGTALVSPSITRAATSAAEDYPGGDDFSVQPGNILTLALHLRLAPQGVQVSAKTGQ